MLTSNCLAYQRIADALMTLVARPESGTALANVISQAYISAQRKSSCGCVTYDPRKAVGNSHDWGIKRCENLQNVGNIFDVSSCNYFCSHKEQTNLPCRHIVSNFHPLVYSSPIRF